MLHPDRPVLAAMFAIGLMTATTAFAEDKNATQNSAPARESGSNSTHVEGPSSKAGADRGVTEGGSTGQAGDGKKVTPTQTSGHDH